MKLRWRKFLSFWKVTIFQLSFSKLRLPKVKKTKRQKKASMILLHSAKTLRFIFLNSLLWNFPVGTKKDAHKKTTGKMSICCCERHNSENSVFPSTSIWMISKETVSIIPWITQRWSGRIWLIATAASGNYYTLFNKWHKCISRSKVAKNQKQPEDWDSHFPELAF